MAVNPTRRNTAIAASVCYLIAIPFLILVLVANIRPDHPALTAIYFFRLDVSQIIPIAVANANLLNSVARSLGLHDFYQVGIWNFCEGYNDEGVTFCSTPTQFYWFNPVDILVSELLAGAQIALPSAVVTVLRLLRIGSQTMYVCFLAGTVVTFVLVFSSILVVRTRWFSLLVGLFAAVAAVFLTVGAAIATAISVAAKIALTSQNQLNIRADIGVAMFVFMWIAAILVDLAFILHAAMACCCCRPNRKASGPVMSSSSSAAAGYDVGESEKKGANLPGFTSRKQHESDVPLFNAR